MGRRGCGRCHRGRATLATVTLCKCEGSWAVLRSGRVERHCIMVSSNNVAGMLHLVEGRFSGSRHDKHSAGIAKSGHWMT